MTDNKTNVWTKGGEDSFAKRWAKYWRSPARPIPQEIAFLRSFFLYNGANKREPKPEVMILGSTTEYRDLMFELRIKPTIVDFSGKNYRILSSRLNNVADNYRLREIFVEQKWQDMKVDKIFDFVLGHFALSINPFEVWDEILKSIYGHLKQGGLFITNNWITGNESMNIDEIIKEYNDKWKGQYTLFGAMMPKIYQAARDKACGKIPYSSICKIIETVHRDGKISNEDYQDYMNMGYKNYDINLFISSEGEFRRFIEKHFIVKDKVIFESYPNAHMMPEWILEKR